MEKIHFNINFEKSGIKTCRNVGITFIVLSIVGFFVSFISGIIAIEGDFPLPYVLSLIMSLILILSFGGLLIAVSFIARNAVIANIQRAELLKQKGIDITFYEADNDAIKF